MTNPEWLPLILQSSTDEIYVLDSDNLRFLHASTAACLNLQYSETELNFLRWTDVIEGESAQSANAALRPLRLGEEVQSSMRVVHVRKDGSSYPVEFRIFHDRSGKIPRLIAIASRQASEVAAALLQNESRFHAIASNTPGLVYQFLLREDGSTDFPYLSKGCHTLLGITAEQLRTTPDLLVKLILPEDRESYFETMAASAADMKNWNWEGRLWIDEWKDIKWINLRATPQALGDGGVQWIGIMTNITQSKREEAELKDSRSQLADLSAHIQKVKEQERARISREIHDDLGGNLTAIKMSLALMARRLPQEDLPLLEKAAYLDSLVDRTIDTVHRIAGDLRPSVLDCGLAPALEWQAAEFEKQLGIPCAFSSNVIDVGLDSDQATALFRIAQEALTNISKHAEASQVELRLQKDHGILRLEIADNGCGIALQDRGKPKSYGIRGMMERALAMGGNLSIEPAPDGGTLVSISLPIALT